LTKGLLQDPKNQGRGKKGGRCRVHRKKKVALGSSGETKIEGGVFGEKRRAVGNEPWKTGRLTGKNHNDGRIKKTGNVGGGRGGSVTPGEWPGDEVGKYTGGERGGEPFLGKGYNQIGENGKTGTLLGRLGWLLKEKKGNRAKTKEKKKKEKRPKK